MFVDAGMGALVTIGLSALPFSPAVGGAVTAFRRDGGYLSGFGVGFVAGFLAMLPLLALFVPALATAGFLGFGVPPSSPAYDVFLALVFLFFLLYTVGLSALGGVTGVWIRDNTAWDLDPARWI